MLTLGAQSSSGLCEEPDLTVQELAPLMPSGDTVEFATSAVNEMKAPMRSVYSATKA